MLLRVFRHRIAPEARDGYEAWLHAEGLPRLRAAQGVNAAYVGRGPDGAYLGMSVWASFEELLVATRGDPLRPLLTPEWAAVPAAAEISHWEALDLPTLRAPVTPTILRAVTGRVRPDAEATYFEYVRTRGWETLAAIPGVVGAWAGRQTEGRIDRFLALTAWRDMTSIEAVGAPGRPILDDDAVRLLTVESVEHFTVVAEAAPTGDAAAQDPRVATG